MCGLQYQASRETVKSNAIWRFTKAYQYNIAVPVDFAMFTGGLFLIELFKFSTLLRLGMAIDPLVGGILGTIGLGTLAKFFRDLGGLSAAISYFFSIR